MSNSKLVNYTKISPHKTSGNFKKDKITIHHMAGNLSVETCGNVFQSRKASTQYGVGSDGRIGQYVDEKDRAWSTANPANDKRAINIEVANDVIGGNWHVSDKALAALIELVTDCCKRNGIAKLNYTGDKNGNVTTHDMFMPTTCPGPYLKSKIPYVVAEVNKRLAAEEEPKEPGKAETKELYRVRKTWSDASSQIGAYSVLDNAKKVVDANPAYKVFNSKGEIVYSVKPREIVEGSKVKISKGAKYYNGVAVPSWVIAKTWIVEEVSGDRVVINKSTDGKNKIMSPINKKYLTLI